MYYVRCTLNKRTLSKLPSFLRPKREKRWNNSEKKRKKNSFAPTRNKNRFGTIQNSRITINKKINGFSLKGKKLKKIFFKLKHTVQDKKKHLVKIYWSSQNISKCQSITKKTPIMKWCVFELALSCFCL